jgi:hypothetical protein
VPGSSLFSSSWNSENPCTVGWECHYLFAPLLGLEFSNCPRYLVQNLLPKSPPPPSIAICSLALGTRSSGGRCVLPFQSPPETLKFLISLLRPHANHPAGQPPRCHPGRQHVVPPHVSHDPADCRAQEGPRPLEQRELHCEEVPVGLVREGETGRVVARTRGGGRKGHSVLVYVRDHGVVLCQCSEDEWGRTSRQIVEKTAGERA